jgi:hypothetical protein
MMVILPRFSSMLNSVLLGLSLARPFLLQILTSCISGELVVELNQLSLWADGTFPSLVQRILEQEMLKILVLAPVPRLIRFASMNGGYQGLKAYEPVAMLCDEHYRNKKTLPPEEPVSWRTRVCRIVKHVSMYFNVPCRK